MGFWKAMWLAFAAGLGWRLAAFVARLIQLAAVAFALLYFPRIARWFV